MKKRFETDTKNKLIQICRKRRGRLSSRLLLKEDDLDEIKNNWKSFFIGKAYEILVNNVLNIKRIVRFSVLKFCSTI